MAFQKLDDIEINGVKLSNIYRQTEYYDRTSGYNYTFYFHCDLEDEDAVYDLCKKAFKEGKNHVRYNGDISTYAVDHDRVLPIKDIEGEEELEYDKKGCNWIYVVKEGNDN